LSCTRAEVLLALLRLRLRLVIGAACSSVEGVQR
jgi:hypothetical protein